jgi:hypothetical protein
MSSKVPRTKTDVRKVVAPATRYYLDGSVVNASSTSIIGTTTSKLWRSEGHPVNRKTGVRDSGGPFHVSHSGPYLRTGSVPDVLGGNNLEVLYSGPVWGPMVKVAAIGAKHQSTVHDMEENSMKADGSTAIAQCAPTNPTAGLSSALAETFREGVPTLPGIQSWQRRTEHLKSLGSEYLNYQFGWAPLKNEVHSVVNAARHHRDIMQNYRHNEGRNVHRRFDFPDEISTQSVEVANPPAFQPLNTTYLAPGALIGSTVVVTCKKVRKRWFEGCFTYGGPSKSDNFGRALGFGSEADAVFGLNLSPDVLWNLTPWSWAVDWFTNAGDLVHNVTNFALAGLVLRYGYMMEETTSAYYTEYSDTTWNVLKQKTPKKVSSIRAGGCSRGEIVVHKSRCPASPFGFGVGWEGLSPTQLAITAALGITRLL